LITLLFRTSLLGPILFTLGSLGGVAILIVMVCQEFELHTLTMLIGMSAWMDRFILLPEVFSLAGELGISSKEKMFQLETERLQLEQEDQSLREFNGEFRQIILYNRGSLDPLAYWLDRSWTEDEFFICTETTLERHYQRYAAVIHLVTAADGAEQAYHN